jgi:Flp pilus assembly protein TadD
MPRTTRFTETFGPHDRRPLVIPALAALGLAVFISCGEKKETQDTTTTISAAPSVVTDTIPTEDVIESGRLVPTNVSFADAESAFTQHRYTEATRMFEVYTQRRPENAWGHYMLGLSAWKAGDLALASNAFERSLTLDPRHVKSLLNLSRVLLEQDRASEALPRVTAATELDSESAEVHRMMGRVRSALEQSDAAIESYRVALSLDPTDVWSMNNMALLLIRQERYEEALLPLARAVQLRPAAPVFQNNFGIALENTGHYVAAREAYRAALVADGDYGKASLSLARVEGRTDDPATVPVETGTLAAAFEQDVQLWKGMREVPLRTSVAAPDSVPVPER